MDFSHAKRGYECVMKILQGKNDIGVCEKMYRLLKIKTKLTLDSIRAKKSFDEILEMNRKREPINIENPQTFDDKIWYMKKHFYSPLVVKCVDKLLVREYVRECGLEEILIPIYGGGYQSPDEIDFSKLPDECYIKCNHTSGCNYLYRRGLTDETWLKKLFALYLKRNYYNVSREWAYRDILPRIIIEKKLESKEKGTLNDYRLFCFDGKLKMVLVNVGTATEQGEHAKDVLRSFYTPDFEWIPEISILGEPKASKGLSKPKNWDKMVDIAQRLSKPFAFCRVDLYNVDEVIYLGELTFTPFAGVNQFDPEEWALKLGSWLDLEKCKNNPVYEYRP